MYVYNLQLYEVIVFVPSGLYALWRIFFCKVWDVHNLTDELEPGARNKGCGCLTSYTEEGFLLPT